VPTVASRIWRIVGAISALAIVYVATWKVFLVTLNKRTVGGITTTDLFKRFMLNDDSTLSQGAYPFASTVLDRGMPYGMIRR
jgi:hypothetical protein